MKLKTLLKRPAITADEAMPIRDARALMVRHGVPCLPVLRQNKLVGMITKLHLHAASPSSVPTLRRYDWGDATAGSTVGDVMSPDPIALTPEASVAEAARLTRAKGVDAVPVVDGGDVVGVVTRRDLLAILGGLLEHRHPTGLGHILAASSLGPGSAGALGEALRVATATGAALTALHVLPRISRLPGFEGATPRQVAWVERTRRRITREALAAMCHAGASCHTTCEVADGPVAHEIARRAAELDSDLIVVGKPRRSARFGFAGPSIADQLARLAPCPVLAVPRERPRDHQRMSRASH
ncbi:MAG: CBS domain-containing protein [Candidatus Rokubacteria bacterium]|nr:CBS domain-containing protein [Candidatus Rokubacteria bacterium]